MNNDDIISTLNDLIETSKDGEDGFRSCADHATDPSLKTFFANRAQSCAAAVLELQQAVRNHGGNPETSSGLGGAIHRRWLDVKSMLTGKDDKAVLQECERGEDYAKSSYQAALKKDLPAEIRSMIEKQYQGVLKNHDQVKSLRDQYGG
ncbi:MAG TPA: PA2169 family four-helix-bundle protein [Noviherbaspirillum sp.]|jgi:uncharacterized protein (TIGR02284 family)|uniref:PA2169 family four-helix-bundle protein n=1 Tax=Noviherbaspirillum sp. TaxID=1926288 RepID=UPI002F95D4B9